MNDEYYSKELVKLYGYSDPIDMVADYILSSIVPAICTNKDCFATYEYEPDQDKGWCSECNTNKVKSILILEGY